MNRLAAMLLVLGLFLSLSACSESCESIVERIDEIEREMENDPESAMTYSAELESLGATMQELKCYEAILDSTFPDR